MHRPLTIALACAIAAPAAAQSSLTLYGVADVGLQFVDSHIKGADSKFGVASGQQAGSRFGLLGRESLGGGTTVEFQIESGFSFETGRSEQGGVDVSQNQMKAFDRLFGREARLGISSAWGSIDLGRFGSLGSGTGSVSMLNGLDPFANAYLDAGAQATQALSSYRVDNAVAIKSSVMAGAQVGAMYSFEVMGPELAGGPRQNMTYWGLAGTYQQGPAWFGASYEVVGAPLYLGPIAKLPVFKIGGNYDFGVVRPFVSYVRTQNWAQTGDLAQYWYDAASGSIPVSGLMFGVEDMSSNAYLIGVSAPVAGGVLRASYQRLEVTEYSAPSSGVPVRDRAGRDVLALGYDYALSKRTTIYGLGSYSWAHGFLDKSHADPTDPDDVALYSQFNRSVVQLGVKHQF